MQKRSVGDHIADVLINILLVLVILITIYPIWYVVAASFTSATEMATTKGMLIWPKEFTTAAYALLIQNKKFFTGFWNTIKVLALGLPVNMMMTLLCGFFMAYSKSVLKKPIMFLFTFTMFFSGGMIPAYLNIKELKLYDSVWALILPGAMSVYYAIICKTAIESLPTSLFESAYLDGANDFQVLLKIVVPLIKPTLAVLLLYYAVGHWNSWFAASVYIKTSAKLPLQNILRAILLANDNLIDKGAGGTYNEYANTIKYAAIVVSSVPILCVYPFLQKYFTKGVMIGAVKG